MVQVEGSPREVLRELLREAPVSRDTLLSYLDTVIGLGFEKLNLRNTTNSERQGWARVIINAVGAASPLLKDVELDKLKSDVEELKSLVSALKK